MNAMSSSLTSPRPQAVVLHLMGPTGSGKTSVGRRMAELAPTFVAHLSVGQVLRQKYPPEFFAGQDAPVHTEVEALAIYHDFLRDNRHKYDLLVIDGQPRRPSQVRIIAEKPFNMRQIYLMMVTDEEIREKRLLQRDSGNPEALDLALRRLQGDYKSMYLCMVEMARCGLELQFMECGESSIEELANRILDQFGI